MSGGWWLAIVAVGVVGWALWVEVRLSFSERLAAWWVRLARGRGRWAGPLSSLVSLACLAAFLVVCLVGAGIAGPSGTEAAALWAILPGTLAYAPFAFATVPSKTTAYRHWRGDLHDAGADALLSRRIAWWAGPVSLLGVVSMLLVLFQILLD